MVVQLANEPRSRNKADEEVGKKSELRRGRGCDYTLTLIFGYEVSQCAGEYNGLTTETVYRFVDMPPPCRGYKSRSQA